MLLWTDDHRPAGAPVERGAPSRWTYRRTMFVPRLSYTGPVRVEAGLYAPDGGARVPLTGEARGNRVVPGGLVHGAAGVEGRVRRLRRRLARRGARASRSRCGSGAGRAATRVCRSGIPGVTPALWLELDQPVAAVGAQRVEVREGPTLLATLAIEPGTRHVSRGAGAARARFRLGSSSSTCTWSRRSCRRPSRRSAARTGASSGPASSTSTSPSK